MQQNTVSTLQKNTFQLKQNKVLSKRRRLLTLSCHERASSARNPMKNYSVRYLSRNISKKKKQKKNTAAGFLQGHPYWTPKKGSKARLAKFWDARIWRNFLCQKMLFLAIFTHFLCTKFHKNSLLLQKWQYLPTQEILGNLVQRKCQKMAKNSIFWPKNSYFLPFLYVR